MYGVLGQVTVAGASVTPRRERELLELLVAAHGRPVAVDRIVEELWADGAPRSSVQVAVSRLRATLDPARSGPSRVERTPAGYRFLAAADEVDAWVFEDLCEKALAAPAAADRVILASQADELWAGEPYPDCQAPTLRAETVRLIELHVTVLEARAEGLLVLGQPAAAVRLLKPV